MSDTSVFATLPTSDPRRHDPLWPDWVTVWQSELAALAVDREMHEAMQRSADGWAAAALAIHDPDGRAGPTTPAGPEAPLAASRRPKDADAGSDPAAGRQSRAAAAPA